MQCIDHKEHLNEAHDTHALAATSCVQLLAKIEPAAIRMSDKGLQHARVHAEIGAEVEQKVWFGGLEVIRLNRIYVLRVAPEGDHVVDFRGHDVSVFEVIERGGCPTMRSYNSFVLILANKVLDSLNRHALSRQDLDLEIWSLVLELLIGAYRDLHPTRYTQKDQESKC